MAINLTLIDSFDFESPDGLARDNTTGNFFAFQNILLVAPITGPEDVDGEVFELDSTGAVQSQFDYTASGLTTALGGNVLPNGNLLAMATLDARIVELDPATGDIVDGGIDINVAPEFDLFAGTNEGEALSGAIYDAASDTVFAVDFFGLELVQIANEPTLNVLNRIDLNAIVPGISPNGITIDPATGNFLIADDIDGNDAIHEITSDGELVTTIDIEAVSGFSDPEGLAIDGNTLYIAFDDDSLTGIEFDNGNAIATLAINRSFLIDQDENFSSTPLLTVGDEIPLLEGEFPFLQTDPQGPFPVENLEAVDSGDNPLTGSATETFALPGSFDGVTSTNIDGTNYVFVNHSIGTEGSTVTNGGQINGSRISLLAFDEDWDVIGGRNLLERVRIASVEGTNALRTTINPDTGTPFLGLVFAEYVLNPETGDYEPDLEAGAPDPDTGEGTFIVGEPAFLALESDVPGLTWQERLEASFAPTFNALGNDNFTSLGSISIAETGFRRRGGQAIPFIFSGDGADNGLAYFHIANGTTVPIEGFGAFAKEQIISALDFRQTADANGVPFGQTVLLSPEASAADGELYMYVGDRVPGNAGGFADFEDTLYVLQVTDAEGNVVADETTITEDTALTAQWVLVDGNPLNDLDAIPDGKAINTLNSGALSDWVNGSDDGILRSTNFANLGGIAEDPNDPSSFYLTSSTGLYNLTFAEDSPTGAGSLTLLQAGDFDSVEVDDDGNVVVQDNAGGSFLYDIATDALTPFVAANQAQIDPDGTPPWELEGINATDDNFNSTGSSAYLTTVAANSLTDLEDSLGVGGQLLLTTPTAPSRFDTDIFRFQSNITPSTYLFTGGSEAQSIRDNFADSFTEEGYAFTVASQESDDLTALYRFQSNSQGTYLLVGEVERDAILNDPNLSGEFSLEGLAFYVYGAGAGEATTFNRLRNLNIPGAYLYATGSELANIQANFTDTYVDEGPAYEAVIM